MARLGWAATFSDQEKMFLLRDKLWRKKSQIYFENGKKEGQLTTDLLESLNVLRFCLEIVKIRVSTVTPLLPGSKLADSSDWLQNYCSWWRKILDIEERWSPAEKISLTLLTLLCSDQINLVCKDNLGQNCCYYWLLWLKLAERLVSARAQAFVVICKTKLKIFPSNCTQSIILNLNLRNPNTQQTDC